MGDGVWRQSGWVWRGCGRCGGTYKDTMYGVQDAMRCRCDVVEWCTDGFGVPEAATDV